jgi:hypothetical protein
MSMLHLLRKYIDSIQFRQVEEESRRKREVKPPESDDDFVGVLPPPPAVKGAPLLTCRVCGYQAETRHPYCPRCLAETMERRR